VLGKKGGETSKVPQGTAERFFRPLRDFVFREPAVPSAEALGYFHGILFLHALCQYAVIRIMPRRGLKFGWILGRRHYLAA
jgi:hypothetical protein